MVDVQARDDAFLESEGCDLDFFHDGVRVGEDGCVGGICLRRRLRKASSAEKNKAYSPRIQAPW